MLAPVRRALLSVSDKTGVVEFARELRERGIELLSTGGTAKLLVSHGIVVKDSLLKEMPWIAGELTRAFETAKAEYLKDLENGGDTSWDKAAAINAKVVGDPFPFGIEKNRKALEAITQFALDQKMVPRKYSVEELFVPVN